MLCELPAIVTDLKTIFFNTGNPQAQLDNCHIE